MIFGSYYPPKQYEYTLYVFLPTKCDDRGRHVLPLEVNLVSRFVRLPIDTSSIASALPCATIILHLEYFEMIIQELDVLFTHIGRNDIPCLFLCPKDAQDATACLASSQTRRSSSLFPSARISVCAARCQPGYKFLSFPPLFYFLDTPQLFPTPPKVSAFKKDVFLPPKSNIRVRYVLRLEVVFSEQYVCLGTATSPIAYVLPYTTIVLYLQCSKTMEQKEHVLCF